MQRATLGILGLLIIAGPAAAKIDMVVMEARGIKLVPGQVIDGSTTLTLADGQQVTLMGEDGKVVKVKGPNDKPPAPTQTAATADVKLALQLLVTQQTSRERAGVIRGGSGLVVPPDPWLVDVGSSGLRCLEAGAPITLWRQNIDSALSLTVAPSDRSYRAHGEWEAGADRFALLHSVPLQSRSTYVVKAGDKEVTLTLISLPTTLTNDAMRASYMMEAGCEAQAKALFAKAGLTAQ